ncbi:GAF domain-containing protein [Neobacillus sp. PS3-12]|uniref:GAF domain-containing protein n=1 Tax=Neobacillus sp. PS3-12 TaxID=3070677 RepID=UPI0027E1F1F7|nr:GAF domain-containing protein [Neobacillus sp. PS3-12]WML55411.1 GAF domain-containing protein [Neobacillus sp. PS3-12]
MSMDHTRYSRLANLTKLINSKLELREVLEHVTTAISEEIVQCDAVGIFLPIGDGKFRGYVGKPDTMNGVKLDSQVIDPEIDLLAREVITTKKTIYISDTSKDSRPDPIPVHAFQIKSILAIPISFEEELYGLAFLFNYGTVMVLTKFEIQSVEAYVNMAAVAIRNANYLKQKENLISEKQLLLDVTRDLSMCSSIQESIDKCFLYLRKILNNDCIEFQLFNSLADNAIKIESSNDDDKERWREKSETINLNKCYDAGIQLVIETMKSIFIPDVLADKRFNQEICRKHSVKSLFLIPLVSMGNVLGIIAIANLEKKEQSFTESQIRLSQSIVDATASTLSSLLYMNELENMIEERTKQLEEVIKNKNNVIESMSEGFISFSKEWRITNINKQHFLHSEILAKDLLGKNIWTAFPKVVGTASYKELNKVMMERIPVHFEFTSTLNGSWYEIVAYPDGDGICALIKDITEKKKYEKELKRLSGLQLIGQMAAGISHEIRNPMTTVRGFLQLLKEANNFEKYKQYIGIMIEELDRANSIITEFLSMSNTRTSDLQELSLNSILYDIAPLIEIDAFNQNKYVKIDTQTIPKLLLNRNEIRQLIINLYRNGLEAMEEGKTLTIRTYKENGCVILAFVDQGEGIKPEVLEKLGTPFFTTKEKGTGLGLGVSYAIAARHNAKIEIQTSVEGSTFFVNFLQTSVNNVSL